MHGAVGDPVDPARYPFGCSRPGGRQPVAGLGSGVAGAAWDTTIQENIPGRILSRMAAYDDFGSYVGIPIGQLLAGPLAPVVGAQHVALAGGISFAVVAVAPLFSPVVRSIRHPTPAKCAPPS